MTEPNCHACLDTGWYEIPNYRLEIMERIECIDCLLEAQYKDHLKEGLTRLFADTSKEKLAQIVADLVVNSVAKNTHDDLQRIDGIIQTKNKVNALALAMTYSSE